ncbi:bacteriohemerythrin [Uliginosibacterium paludis]|uniref:Bacteriohemerythrin n=1 Tax=Uliginosibacterium paludis TaxID=1615952 RepID=A0ABV2CT92_9RHOO
MIETKPAELFTWNDSYKVGVEEIDSQHKELVRLLNELHVSIREHHGSATSREILNQLVDYTRTHFMVEESLMRVSAYPEMQAHKHQHETLIEQVRALQEKLDSGVASISFELLHFLKRWLMHHINGDDKQFGAYFQQSKGAPQTGTAPGEKAPRSWWSRVWQAD